jgi:hypothetical protein
VAAQRQILTERQSEEDKVLTERIARLTDRLEKTRHDLEISKSMLDMTKCDGTLFLSHVAPSRHTGIKDCQRPNGDHDIVFDNDRLRNLTGSLTSEGRWQLQLAIGRSRLYSKGLVADILSKEGALDIMEDGEDLMMLKTAVDPTKKVRYDENQASKCTMARQPSCGETHDIFVSLWGDMKENLYQLEKELDAERQSKKDFRENVKNQLVALGNSQGVLEAGVADIESLQADLAGERAGKARETDRMKLFASEVDQECTVLHDEVVLHEMCAITKLRDEVAKLAGLGDQEDCKVSEWKQVTKCSKSCGGGEHSFQRSIIKQGTSLGAVCPVLQIKAVCNDVGCPVDCKLGTWAAWSDCTQACGGGLRYRIRQREVEPRNGGFACGVMQETQQCNTGACDRNCQLGEWSAFSSCSQACDAGFSSRRKLVLQPEIGAGRCPEKDSSERLERQECNKHKCAGDEKCVSKLDVVIAIDGSGSMTDSGFTILREFGSKFAERLQGGADEVRAGVVQFGNGQLDNDGVVSDAILALSLSTDIDSVSSTITGLTFQQGFTNLAQGAIKARDLLNFAAPRSGAGKLIVVLTDGRPSFRHMAQQAMQQLKDVSRVMVVHVKTFPEQHNMDILKGYVTEPAEVNYLHIGGKKALEESMDAFVTKLVVQACEDVQSPSSP